MADIASVDLESMVAYTDDGQRLPVTNLMDADGEDLQEPTSGVLRVVAGPCAAGKWYGFFVEPEAVN